MTRGSTPERFVMEHMLGQGGMGTVHQAYDNTRGTTVAVKMLRRVDPNSLLRFKTEFRSLANLSHRNLLQLFELVQLGEDYLLSMELVDGTDFLSHVRSRGTKTLTLVQDGNTESMENGPANDVHPRESEPGSLRAVAQLDEGKLRHALRQLAEGLNALHSSGHLHRDLKPANVLVFRSDARVVICDFGLVVETVIQPVNRGADLQGSAPRTDVSASTTSGVVAGTLAFMSPEQTAGAELTAACDWYAVGAMLYQALTLRVPFDPHLPWADAVRARQERLPEHPLTIDPDLPADLANLTMALLQTDPQRRAGYAEVIATLDGRETLVVPQSATNDLLIGRERELSLLHGALDVTRQGKPCTALVSGMSGMGKSAVVQRFLSECERSGALVLRGRCYECEDLPYKAFDPLMDALSNHLLALGDAQVTALLPPDANCLAELFPVLGRVPAIERKGLVSAVADPFERKRRAITACKRLLRGLATERPLVLHVDDLQWGDLDSAALFSALLRGSDAPPLLLLFAFRAEDEEGCALLRSLREEAANQHDAQQRVEVRVNALSMEDAERLARALLSGISRKEEAIRAVVEEACGSPFFIRELASFVRSQGVDAVADLTLANVLKARFAALPEHSRTLLEFVAVAGRPEPQSLLQEASGLGKRAFAAGQILKAHNMVHASGGLEQARVEVYHDRIRETVYSELSADRRRYLHRVLAVTLEEYAERHALERDAESLCEHWHRAGERKRAFDYAILAAGRAEATLAFLHAAKLYKKAIELIDANAADVSSLEGRMGKALMFAGRGVDAADAFFRAMEHAGEQAAQDYRRLAITQLLNAGSLDRAFAELRNAEDVLGLSFPRTNLKAIGMLIWRRLRTRLNDAALNARGGKNAPERISQRLDNLYKVSTALSTVDFLRGGVYTAEHTLRALEHGHPYHLATALSIESIRSAGPNTKPAQTQWIIEQGAKIAQASSDPYALAVTTGTAGVARYLEGRFEEAIRLVRESQRIHRERLNATMAWDLSTMCFFEMRALSQVGRVHEIVARVPDVLRDAEARGDLYSSTLFRVSRLCWAWLGAGEPELAQQNIEVAQRQWVQEPYQLVHYYTLQAAGETALYRERAHEVWQRALSERKQMSLVTKIQFTRVENLYLTGRLALQIARTKKDPAALREAVKCAKALGREKVHWSQLLGQLIAACAASRDAKEEAKRLLSPLPEAFGKLDMLLPAAVASYRLGQLQGGADGQAVLDAMRNTMRGFGIANPDAFVEMLAPLA